jgi:hypothetical protein
MADQYLTLEDMASEMGRMARQLQMAGRTDVYLTVAFRLR